MAAKVSVQQVQQNKKFQCQYKSKLLEEIGRSSFQLTNNSSSFIANIFIHKRGIVLWKDSTTKCKTVLCKSFKIQRIPQQDIYETKSTSLLSHFSK